ncbi:MAG: DUF2922 domain-containing protein [Clostridium sp.]|nr:DUF2922 domain-containing protein [Clostridium sp.]
MEETRVLYMSFKNYMGKTCTITLDDPIEDIEEEQIVEVMNLIKDKAIFLPGGYDIVECVSAKIVNAETVTFDLEI